MLKSLELDYFKSNGAVCVKIQVDVVVVVVVGPVVDDVSIVYFGGLSVVIDPSTEHWRFDSKAKYGTFACWAPVWHGYRKMCFVVSPFNKSRVGHTPRKTNMSSKKGLQYFNRKCKHPPPIFQGICEFSGPVSDAWKTRLPNLSPFGSVTLPPQLKLWSCEALQLFVFCWKNRRQLWKGSVFFHLVILDGWLEATIYTSILRHGPDGICVGL